MMSSYTANCFRVIIQLDFVLVFFSCLHIFFTRFIFNVNILFIMIWHLRVSGNLFMVRNTVV